MKERISKYTSKKTPHFFVYAKDKTEAGCEPVNGSVVNMLEQIVENKRMCFSAKNIGKFDYRYMMANKNQEIDPAVVERFYELDGNSYRKISASTNEGDVDYGYLRLKITSELEAMTGDITVACDMLIKEMFTRNTVAHKSTFWFCFGDIVYENLKNNIPYGSIQCDVCGKRIIKNAPNQCRCEKCSTYTPKGIRRGVCIDCGHVFYANSKSNKKKRCDACQMKYRKRYRAEYERVRYDVMTE